MFVNAPVLFRPLSGNYLEHQRAQLSAGVHLARAERGATRARALHGQRIEGHRDPGQDQRRPLAPDGHQVRQAKGKESERLPKRVN